MLRSCVDTKTMTLQSPWTSGPQGRGRSSRRHRARHGHSSWTRGPQGCGRSSRRHCAPTTASRPGPADLKGADEAVGAIAPSTTADGPGPADLMGAGEALGALARATDSISISILSEYVLVGSILPNYVSGRQCLFGSR